MSSGPRQAALLLHAMLPSDREWLLGQLPVNARSELQSMLGELNSLGIAPEPGLVKKVALEISDEHKREPIFDGAALAKNENVPRKSSEDAMEFLLYAQPSAIAQVLRNEPAGLIARLLKVKHWTWSEAVLSQLGAIKRRNVEDAMATITAVPPGFAEAMVMQLAQHVEKMNSVSQNTMPTHRYGLPDVRHSVFKRIFSFKNKSASKQISPEGVKGKQL